MVSVICDLTLLVRYAHVSIPVVSAHVRDAVDRVLGAAGGQTLQRTLIALPQLNALMSQKLCYQSL